MYLSFNIKNTEALPEIDFFVGDFKLLSVIRQIESALRNRATSLRDLQPRLASDMLQLWFLGAPWRFIGSDQHETLWFRVHWPTRSRLSRSEDEKIRSNNQYFSLSTNNILWATGPTKTWKISLTICPSILSLLGYNSA